MGGLGARERGAVETVEGAFFESVWLVVGSGRHVRDECSCNPEGIGALPCTLCHSVGKSGRRVHTGSKRLTAGR